MDRMRVNRVARVGRVGMSAAAIPLARQIVSVGDNGGGEALYTTAAAHGLVGSETLTVSGTSGAAYDGAGIAVQDAPSTTTFHTAQVFTGSATGGTWLQTG